MSYNKMMSRMKGRRLTFKPRKMYYGCDVLGDNERRRFPWLGGSWYEEGREVERAEVIRQWEVETERLLKLDPTLKII